MTSCVVTGSSLESYQEIREAAEVFRKASFDVLYPRNTTHIENIDRLEASLDICDFLYVCNPGGRVLNTTNRVIGYARGQRKPIFVSDNFGDERLRRYINGVIKAEELAARIMLNPNYLALYRAQ